MPETPAFMYAAWFGEPGDIEPEVRIEVFTSEEQARECLGAGVGDVWRFPVTGGTFELAPPPKQEAARSSE